MVQIFYNDIQKEYYCPSCKFEKLSPHFKYCPNCREDIKWMESLSSFLFDWDDSFCLLRPKVQYLYYDAGLKKGSSCAVYYNYATKKVLLANGLFANEQSVTLYNRSFEDDEETGSSNVAAYLLEYGILFYKDVKIKVGSKFLYSPPEKEPTQIQVQDIVWSYEQQEIYILFKRGLKISNLIGKEESEKFCTYSNFRTSIYKSIKEEIKDEL